jgi:hypothetical protein
MESFFHSMKAEELYGKSFASAEELRQALLRYIAFATAAPAFVAAVPPSCGLRVAAGPGSTCQLNRCMIRREYRERALKSYEIPPYR